MIQPDSLVSHVVNWASLVTIAWALGNYVWTARRPRLLWFAFTIALAAAVVAAARATLVFAIQNSLVTPDLWGSYDEQFRVYSGFSAAGHLAVFYGVLKGTRERARADERQPAGN